MMTWGEIMFRECQPYLKDGETPLQCIERHRADIDSLMALLANEKRKTEMTEVRYWMSAVALASDWLDVDDKRMKVVAVLRNAALRLGGQECLEGKPVPPESIHDICHNLHGAVGALEFAAGCAGEQRALFGCAPDADRVEQLKSGLRKYGQHTTLCNIWNAFKWIGQDKTQYRGGDVGPCELCDRPLSEHQYDQRYCPCNCGFEDLLKG